MKTVSFEGRVCFASVSFGLEPFSRTRNALFEVIRQNSIMVIFGWGMKNFNFRGVVRGRFFRLDSVQVTTVNGFRRYIVERNKPHSREGRILRKLA